MNYQINGEHAIRQTPETEKFTEATFLIPSTGQVITADEIDLSESTFTWDLTDYTVKPPARRAHPAHVRINNHYTATVHAVEDLEDFLSRDPEQIDLSVFDVVRSHEDPQTHTQIQDFVRSTRKARLAEQGFAAFNDCPHTAVAIPDSKMHTITVTFLGEQVTLCFIPNNNGAECMDILRHTAEGKQSLISFDGGIDRTDVKGTLATLMLRDMNQ